MKLCAACGERAKVLVGSTWRDPVCARLSPFKYESAVDEWARIRGGTPCAA